MAERKRKKKRFTKHYTEN